MYDLNKTYITPSNFSEWEPLQALAEGLQMVGELKSTTLTLPTAIERRKSVWCKELDALAKEAQPATVIAVCGGTGAGKSSLLNAVLQENILPTSGMSACTGVVTEIGYREKPGIEAEIEFLTEDEWRTEISVLRDDLGRMSASAHRKLKLDQNTPAGIAWHKLRAVYPALAPEKIEKMSTEQIVALRPDVSSALGSTQKVIAENAESFSQIMPRYINSQRSSDSTCGESAEVTYWPIIRVVKIRCNSPCLATGAVLVDLPGMSAPSCVGDTNIARSNVCSSYMKNARYIWVVAPITRAVDDKIARDLFGEAFKLQLTSMFASVVVSLVYSSSPLTPLLSGYDDRTVTFIATKTDDVDPTEIVRQLGLDDTSEMKQLDQQIAHLKANVDELDFGATETDHCSVAQKEVRHTSANIAEDDSPSRPDAELGKRKRESGIDLEDQGPRKIQKESVGTFDWALTGITTLTNNCKRFTSTVHFDRSRAQEAPYVEKIASTPVFVHPSNSDITGPRARLELELQGLQKRRKLLCAKRRNEFSKSRLQEDFRLGIMQAHGGAAEQNDPDNYDPDGDARDYDGICLPVFTCSSRDYQRLQNIGNIPETERALLRERWESQGTDIGIADRLTKDLDVVIEDCVAKFQEELKASLAEHCRSAAVTASGSAADITDEFSTGMHFNTYLAAIRHRGCFDNRNLNEELLAPFFRSVAPVWAKIFEGDKFFSPFQVLSAQIISTLLSEVESSTANECLKRRINNQRTVCLEHADNAFAQAFYILQNAVKEKQKEISRSLVPQVKDQLGDGYSMAMEMKGKGCVKRQKECLHIYVSDHKDDIFNQSVDCILQTGLGDLAAAVRGKVRHPFENLAQKIEVDLAVCWDHDRDEDKEGLAVRLKAANVVAEVMKRSTLWLDAVAELDEEFVVQKLLDVSLE
ncbi:hypothetical protein PQX77_012719 [Marasmius sp. AFHP31]|nr:hypothetical protein PQX77_012719 [Marasmius sp. AFHP31]